MRVSGLFLYPVKGCRGLAVNEASVDALGFVGDRRFLIITEDGKFITQRTLPKLALIETALSAENLRLTMPEFGAMDVPLVNDSKFPKLRPVQIWNDSGLLAEDCGESAHAWLSAVLAQRVCLVRLGPSFVRPVKNNPADHVMAADAYPFLIISEASLTDLNSRLAAEGSSAVPMNRFRPNIVVEGAEPFAEDAWVQVQIGKLVFRAGGLCQRCIVTTTDQSTGVRAKEPLRTLATYRRDPNDPNGIIFGQNLIHENKTGTLRIGDPVSVLR